MCTRGKSADLSRAPTAAHITTTGCKQVYYNRGIYNTCTFIFDVYYRWQRETSALTSKFEKALLDMNTKVTEERRKSKELTSKLKLQTANTERVSVITVQYNTSLLF